MSSRLYSSVFVDWCKLEKCRIAVCGIFGLIANLSARQTPPFRLLTALIGAWEPHTLCPQVRGQKENRSAAVKTFLSDCCASTGARMQAQVHRCALLLLLPLVHTRHKRVSRHQCTAFGHHLFMMQQRCHARTNTASTAHPTCSKRTHTYFPSSVYSFIRCTPLQEVARSGVQGVGVLGTPLQESMHHYCVCIDIPLDSAGQALLFGNLLVESALKGQPVCLRRLHY
eukprot:1157717-Pelagomonas_calceolata.AAC.1